MKVKIPKEDIGFILFLFEIRISKGAKAAPNFPIKVQKPKPIPLIGVGYNSGPYTYEILNATLTAIFAIMPY